MSLQDRSPVPGAAPDAIAPWQRVVDGLAAIVDAGEAFLDRLDSPSNDARVFVSLAATPTPAAFAGPVTVDVAMTTPKGRKPLSLSFDPVVDGFVEPVDLLSLCGTAHAALACRPLLVAVEAAVRRAAATFAERLAAAGLTVGFVKAHRPGGEGLWIEQASLDGLPIVAGLDEEALCRMLAATASVQQEIVASGNRPGMAGPPHTIHMRRNATEKDLDAIQPCAALFRRFASRPSVVAASVDEARARIVAHDALLADRGLFRLPPSFGDPVPTAPEAMSAIYGTQAPMPPTAKA